MYCSLGRAAAAVWLTCFEFYLIPLRALVRSGQTGQREADFRELQEDVWREMLFSGRGRPIEEPIFTDAVMARARSL
jgi:hypothetical protein